MGDEMYDKINVELIGLDECMEKFSFVIFHSNTVEVFLRRIIIILTIYQNSYTYKHLN